MIIKKDNQIKQTSEGLISSWAVLGVCHAVFFLTVVHAGANLSRKQLVKFKAFEHYYREEWGRCQGDRAQLNTVTCLKRRFHCQLKYHTKPIDLHQRVSNTAIEIRHQQRFIASFDPFWQVFMPGWTLVWQVVQLFKNKWWLTDCSSSQRLV